MIMRRTVRWTACRVGFALASIGGDIAGTMVQVDSDKEQVPYLGNDRNDQWRVT